MALNFDKFYQDADFLPSFEELQRYKTKLELFDNECEIFSKKPRARYIDEYDSLGRNITEQERRQNRVPWVKVKYVSGKLFIPQEKKEVLRGLGLI